MLFWIIAALLTVGASLVVLLPLTARGSRVVLPQAHDLEVYRDQLSELDRDAARGLIAPVEAEEARVEIARRILKAAEPEAGIDRAPRSSSLSRYATAAAVLAVPLVSWGLYTGIGSPDLPGQPLSARLSKNPADQSMEELLARAETHLVGNPEDGRGWDVVAPVYFRLGRFDDAAGAYRNAIRLLGDDAARQSGLGESLANASGGMVTAEAEAAFAQAVKLDKANAKARFYLATALAQRGDLESAQSAWQAMLTDLPPETPWRGAVANALDEVARARTAQAPANAAPGPAQADVDVAAEMTPEDRKAMIEGMVANLDEKLRENPNDTEGWIRLVRSYMVLNDAAKARDALARGLTALDATSVDGKRLAQFASGAGITAAE